jgi:hypothetical protein
VSEERNLSHWGRSNPAIELARDQRGRPTIGRPFVEYLLKWSDLLQLFWKEPPKPVNG